MHPQSSTLTIGENVQKESNNLDILGVTFDYKMTFEKHLRWVSRAASQRLGILWKSDEYSKIDRFLGDASGVLSCTFFSSALQCGARLPKRTLNYWTCSQWCLFSNWGVFELDITHRRSVAVQCMLYKIRCNPMHSLYGALPLPYVPVRVTRVALVAHR